MAESLGALRDALLLAVRASGASADDARTRARLFMEAVEKASPDDAEHAVREYAEVLTDVPIDRLPFAAIVGGALVERGADPDWVEPRLTGRLADVLEEAVPVAELADARIDRAGPDEDTDQIFAGVREELKTARPDQLAALDALDRMLPPCMAIYQRSAHARRYGRCLLDRLEQIGDWSETTHWLARLLKVLDDEPFVAIEPATGLGIEGRLNGVADNFQLHMLLMDAFPLANGSVPPRLTPAAAAAAWGAGAVDPGVDVVGTWNLHAHAALSDQGTVPAGVEGMSTWIWNEGTPADIPPLDDHRVILLGPASYERIWPARRAFANLRAELGARELPPREVSIWLGRIIAARPAG